MARQFHTLPMPGGALAQPVRLLANMEAAEKLHQTRRAYLTLPMEQRAHWCAANETLANWMFDVEDLAASAGEVL